MNDKDFANVQELFSACKIEWNKQKPVWDDISHFTGITLDTNYLRFNNQSRAAKPLDEFVDDPTSAISVNQGGDYLRGIMWGTGENVLRLKPSRYVTALIDPEAVKDYYAFATDQLLYHINHEQSGFSTALQPYVYDQFSFGTSGIGCFKNKAFQSGIEENALIFNNYGVDNTVIDEGKSGQVDIMFAVYHWRVNRIVGEFATEGGAVVPKLLAKLPKVVREAYEAGQYNTQFNVVFGFYPRSDYSPKLKGKRGARYKGVWFLDQANDNSVFFEEDFKERPAAIARAIKVRGERYGRASGTLLISTIRSTNFMVSTAIEIVEKMSNPSLGLLNNAIFGDSVLDTSPNGLTVFQQMMAASSNTPPIFPLHEVGDPSAILQFLVPYLNEKIVTAFKIDALLDLSSAKGMTATEALQRYAIRGKSLSGFLLQQKNELLQPLTKRAISVLQDLGELGAHPTENAALAEALMKRGMDNRIIPEAVAQVMSDGRPWFEIEWNNELEKLTRTEAIQNLVQLLQSITAIAAMNPMIIEAVDWYSLLRDINDNLDINSKILYTEDEFKEKMAVAAQRQAAMMAMQQGQMGAVAAKDASVANKNNKEAENVGQPK